MTITTPTSAPWELQDRGDVLSIWSPGERRTVVGISREFMDSVDQTRADLAHIVRCVNAEHEKRSTPL